MNNSSRKRPATPNSDQSTPRGQNGTVSVLPWRATGFTRGYALSSLTGLGNAHFSASRSDGRD